MVMAMDLATVTIKGTTTGITSTNRPRATTQATASFSLSLQDCKYLVQLTLYGLLALTQNVTTAAFWDISHETVMLGLQLLLQQLYRCKISNNLVY
jgi:hypothetical protein